MKSVVRVGEQIRWDKGMSPKRGGRRLKRQLPQLPCPATVGSQMGPWWAQSFLEMPTSWKQR